MRELPTAYSLHLRCRFRRDRQASCFLALKSRQKNGVQIFVFCTSSLPERVQISFTQIKSTAKLLPAALFA